jgi:hypothetical protein
MPVGECQAEFAAAAAEDGYELQRQSFPWLCEQGHFGLIGTPPASPKRIEIARDALERILEKLGGDPVELAAGRTNPLRGDFLHESTGTLIEIDEFQHFTSFRLTTMDLYPDEVPLGFDPERYRGLCLKWRAKADAYRRAKSARVFGAGGRQRQRAYYDALRDLGTWAMGRPSLLRVDATHDNGRLAYRQHRDRIHEALAG